MGRLFLAFLLAPLTPGVLIAFAGATYLVVTDSRISPSDFFGLTAVAGLLGYPFALLLGLPAYHVLRMLRLDSAWIYGLAGAVFGALALAVYPPLLGFASATVDVTVIPIMLLCGVATTLTFWIIARPDRRPRNAEPA